MTALRLSKGGHVLPTLHLNGSGLERLEQGLQEQISALRAARDAVEANAPHPRDYYPQGEDASVQARREHRARVVLLDGLLAAFVEASSDLQEQASERRKR